MLNSSRAIIFANSLGTFLPQVRVVESTRDALTRRLLGTCVGLIRAHCRDGSGTTFVEVNEARRFAFCWQANRVRPTTPAQLATAATYGRASWVSPALSLNIRDAFADGVSPPVVPDLCLIHTIVDDDRLLDVNRRRPRQCCALLLAPYSAANTGKNRQNETYQRRHMSDLY